MQKEELTDLTVTETDVLSSADLSRASYSTKKFDNEVQVSTDAIYLEDSSHIFLDISGNEDYTVTVPTEDGNESETVRVSVDHRVKITLQGPSSNQHLDGDVVQAALNALVAAVQKKFAGSPTRETLAQLEQTMYQVEAIAAETKEELADFIRTKRSSFTSEKVKEETFL